MKRALLFLFVCLVAVVSSSADEKQSVKTSTEGGRYEIIQSNIVRRLTIKLDKYTGQTYLMVKSKDDTLSWEKMEWYGTAFEEEDNDKINYQIFMGGIMAKDCILLNIHTGRTWMLFEDSRTENLYWSIMF